MPDASDHLRPSQLWKKLSPDRKTIAAAAFWRDGNALAEHAEALAIIAQRTKSRVKTIIAMPVEKKARHLVGVPALSEAVAARLLVAYHLEQQRPMMSAFLDVLGIAHDNGLIAEEHLTRPAAERLTAAARTIGASYPAADVSLYLSTLLWQDPDTWGGLADAPETRVEAVSAT
jgi:hypothetical protein